MPLYRLHYFPESGNSYKLALMLTLCGETFEPVWTNFGGSVTRTAEWRKAVNEMGEIPVLEESHDCASCWLRWCPSWVIQIAIMC
ncbi:glutathione S-transferase [Bradyrhizobium sp. cir1]|nr:glutathione S-transferase [Bradyrhizobium sp. cir1]